MARLIGSTMPKRVLRDQARLAPQDPQTQDALGLTFRQAKRNEEARQAFEKAAQLAPDNLWMMDQLVELDLLDKHFDAAAEDISASSKKRPIRRPLIFLKAKFWLRKENGTSAAAELQKTLQLDPNFSSAYDLLVQTYIAANKLPQAVSQLQANLRRTRITRRRL